jgi:carbonic anhydrase
MMGGASRPAAAQSALPAPPNAIPADDALARLMAGNARYAANTSANQDHSAGRAARATAQYPIAAFVSCADSRVSPELAFDQGPGELFVVRVAGNFVHADGLASLEFGVAVLGIPLIMVLGHSNCGAVAATIKVIQEGTQLPGHLPDLVRSMKPGVERAIAQRPADLLAAATIENVRHNVGVLSAATPIVAPAVSAGRVKVVGGVYDIGTGQVRLV